MNLFANCERCNSLANWYCGCSDSPHFLCENHAAVHMKETGNHKIVSNQDFLFYEQVLTIKKAYKKYRESLIRRALLLKTTKTDHLHKKIKIVHEEYNYVLETILAGPVSREIQEIVSFQALPLFSDSSVVRTLLDFKKTHKFSRDKLHKELVSLGPSLYLLESNHIIQPILEKIHIKNPFDPRHYRWELYEDTKANDEPICSLAVSDCEQYIASGYENNLIKIWEVQTLRLIRTLKGHKSSITSIAFIGNKIVSVSTDTTIRFWKEDVCFRTLEYHSHWVNSVCVSSSRTLIVTGSADKTAKVYSLVENRDLQTLAHSHPVRSVAFSKNDKSIVCGCEDGGIRIWGAETGVLNKTLKAHNASVLCVSNSENFIVSASWDGTVKLWDNSKLEEQLLTFADHNSVVWSTDIRNHVVASLGADDRIILRDIRSGTIIQTLQGHGKYKPFVYIQKCLWISKGAVFIVSGGPDGRLRIYRKVD